MKAKAEKYYVVCQGPSNADQLCLWHFINYLLNSYSSLLYCSVILFRDLIQQDCI